MAISNVSLTNTFDQWRIVTNQMVTVINDIEFTSNLVRTQSNTTPLVITSSVGRGGTLYFDVSTNSSYTNASVDVLATSNAVNKLYIYLDSSVNSVNNYANALGISGNTYANNLGSAGNTYTTSVGISGNTYANAVGASANAYAASLTPDLTAANNWANTIGITSNTYANAVGISGNTYANAVGAAANAYSLTVSNGALTDASTIAWNLDTYQVAVVTLNGSRTMGVPSNMRVGTFLLHVKQNTSGNSTLSFPNTTFKWTAQVAPTLTTTANARDIISFICDGTYMYGSFLPDVR